MSWYIFSVPGKPQGKGRPRASVVAGHARLHTPPATQLYENWIRQCWLERFQGVRLSGPVKIQGVAFFEVPKSYSKNKKLLCTQNVTPPTCKPDWDNIGKALCDALNGIAYGDDASIYDAHIVKRWGSPARLVVCITGEDAPREEQVKESKK